MRPQIFEYRSYRTFLSDVLRTFPRQGRGTQGRLAVAAGCQPAYVSHVLSGRNDFSAEQIEGVAGFLGLPPAEKEFLITLLLFERAGTPSLKKFYESLLARLSQQNANLHERIRARDQMDEVAKATYYSSWHYSAVHMLATIPEMQTREAILRYLGIPAAKLDEVLAFLANNGLLEKSKNRFLPKTRDLHLDRDSPFIERHHGNWRTRALVSLDRKDENDLHYSLAFTVQRDDLPKIREALTQAIENCAAIIRPSGEEELAVLCLDLFSLRASPGFAKET